MEKSFSLESADRAEGADYHAKLLNIINDIEKRVRVIDNDAALNLETHEKRYFDSKGEQLSFEEIRRDVCGSFGVNYDSNHLFIYDPDGSGPKEQRALRAFFVVIDTVNEEGFYGEGRIDHNTLLNALVSRLRHDGQSVTFESFVEGMDADPPHYLVFKGFLSIKDFKEISDSSRRVLETPIFDHDGKPIDTAETWFITGHNLPGSSA